MLLAKEKFKTSIGGQAIIEGIMMRGPEKSSMAVRLPNGEIDIETWDNPNSKKWYRKTPFIRGGFNMIDSLFVGYSCLMKSANKSGLEDEEDEQPSKFELWLSKTFGKSLMSVVSALALVIGVGLAMGLFVVLPSFLVGLLARFVELAPIGKSLIEGAFKITVFIGYLALVSRMSDIRRVFEYHGAEHKTITCYEAGQELTVENIRTKSRFHPRCGTSFLLIVMVISILIFSVVTWSSVLIRVLLKILLLPVVVGISYEIIRFAGRHDNIITRFISAPGMWLQRLTTREPDDSQIQVAIASMGPVVPETRGSDEW